MEKLASSVPLTNIKHEKAVKDRTTTIIIGVSLVLFLACLGGAVYLEYYDDKE